MKGATIQIKRRAAWGDLLRSYQIVLDGACVGTIRQGKSHTFEVHPGHHELFLTIDWCSSQCLLIDVEPGEEVHLVCQGRNALFALYNITSRANDYIQLFREPF